MKRRFSIWASPAGAAIALVCFFLPWYDYSCTEKVLTEHGYDMGWPFYAVPAAAAGMLVAFAIAKWRGDAAAARPVILGLSSVLPLLLAFFLWFVLFEGTRLGVHPVVPGQDDGDYHRIRYGFVGEIAGLLLAQVGAWGLKKKPPPPGSGSRVPNPGN